MSLSENFIKYFMSHPIRMRLLFLITFIIYGFLISIISFSIFNHYQTKQTKIKLLQTQEESFKVKSLHLKNLMQKFINEIESIKGNTLFEDYVNNKIHNRNVKEIFSVMMNHNKQLSQLRFIDENGFERIRFDRSSLTSDAKEISKEHLQNKASRYYFKEVKKTENNSIWYSNLDLNIEYGKIEMPIVPTLRIGTPIYIEGRFKGIIIMNIFFKDILEEFTSSPFFYITVYDKDGEFIYHKHLDEDEKIMDYSWSRYLNKDFNLDIHKKNLERLLSDYNTKDYILYRTIKDIIPNKENLAVYYEPKILKLKEIESNEKQYIITVTILVLFISIPLALIISVIPNMINYELFQTKKLLEEKAKIVDEYVYLSITDNNGYILDVSHAYEELTGYSKDELIGNKHNILRHPTNTNAMYKNLWNTILDKKVWEGEIQNLKKSGATFHAKLLIKPNLDEENELKGFTSYVQDITYQKKVERISVTDELTGLYNRREFNKVFKRYASNSKRYSNPFSLIVFDIDFFKQYNDTYGHVKGDKVLKEVAIEVQKISLRSTDVGFRLGGEEFGLFFSSNSLNESKDFAERLRKNIENLKIEHSGSKINKYLTISVGLFYSDNLKALNVEEIYSICDESLYKAKNSGRNQVAVVSI